MTETRAATGTDDPPGRRDRPADDAASRSPQRPSTEGSSPAGPDEAGRPRAGVRARLHRQRERIRARPAANQAYRVGVAVVGVGIMALGIPLVPLPGPGWLVVFVGLGVLASEFSWAHRLKEFGLRLLRRWTDWVKARSRAVQGLLGLATAVVVVLAVWGYLAWTGVPGWLPDVLTRLLERVPGI